MWGYYDVSMLCQPTPLLEDEVTSASISSDSDASDPGANCTDKNEWDWDFIHPDAKFEELMTKQRRDRRTAQLLLLKNSIIETLPESTDISPPPKSAPPHINCLRADTSWIKDIPPSPQAGLLDTENIQAEASADLTEEVGEEQADETEMINMTLTDSSMDTVTREASNIVSGILTLRTSTSSRDHSSDSDGDFIPPGTVRQQTADIEHRLKQHSGNSSSDCLTPPASPASSSESHTSSLGEPQHVDSNIYGIEEINVPRGFVKITKQDLEMKAR